VYPLAGHVERRYLLLEGLRHRVLLSTVAVQATKGEAVRLSVFRFAVREAGKPSKPPPVCRAGVSVVPLGQCLRGKGSEELRKRSRMLELDLKVAGAGLDNSTWVEAVGREPRERGLAEIVKVMALTRYLVIVTSSINPYVTFANATCSLANLFIVSR
jgi:hypothetical protein